MTSLAPRPTTDASQAFPLRRLTCAVCGGRAGEWRQWHNQDTGWGVCAPCVTVLTTSRGYQAAEIAWLYGDQGTHWGEATALPPSAPA